jgi:hypothetical protein
MFDPSYPPTDAEIESAPLRAQFNALNDDIQTRSTVALMNATVQSAVGATSNNSNSVATLNMMADSFYNSNQLQDVMNKLDELINALRR